MKQFLRLESDLKKFFNVPEQVLAPPLRNATMPALSVSFAKLNSAS